MSSPMRSSKLMHSMIVEQAGRVDIVVDSQTPSVPLASIRASPSIMSSGAPTPNTTDLSFSFHSLRSRGTPRSEKSQNLSLRSGPHSPNSSSDTRNCDRPCEDPSALSSEMTVRYPSPPLSDSIPSSPPPHPPDKEPPPSRPDNQSGPASVSASSPSPAAIPTVVQRPTHITLPSTPHFPAPQSETLFSLSTAPED